MLKDTNTYLDEKQQIIFLVQQPTLTSLLIFKTRTKYALTLQHQYILLLISHIKEVIDFYSTVTDFAKFRG